MTPHPDLTVLVRAGERSVNELVAELGISQPSVSKHLRALKDAGLVQARVAEQRRIYRLTPGPLRELDSWLEPYRQSWAASRLSQACSAVPANGIRTAPTPGIAWD